MLDLVSGLIWLAIILAFVTPWLRAKVARRRMPPIRGGRPTGGPRAFAESGGYQPGGAAPGRLANPFPETRHRPLPDEMDHVEDPSLPRSFPRGRSAPPALADRPRTVRATALRTSLASPGSVRNALVIKEILDAPVSLRNTER